jgi:DNA-binding transcriptional regulator GbsR (MarR family)
MEIDREPLMAEKDEYEEGSATARVESARVRSRVIAVCDAVGEFIAYWGFKSIQGRVWAYLALSSVPRSQREIAEALGTSKALISSTIAELEQLGLVGPVDKRRAAPYVASINVWPVISDVLRSREWMLLESARVAAEALVEELRNEPSHGFDPTRARYLLNFTTLAQALLKSLLGLRSTRPSTVAEIIQKAARFFLEGR